MIEVNLHLRQGKGSDKIIYLNMLAPLKGNSALTGAFGVRNQQPCQSMRQQPPQPMLPFRAEIPRYEGKEVTGQYFIATLSLR